MLRNRLRSEFLCQWNVYVTLGCQGCTHKTLLALSCCYDSVVDNYFVTWKVRVYANLVSNLQSGISVTKQIFKLVTYMML